MLVAGLPGFEPAEHAEHRNPNRRRVSFKDTSLSSRSHDDEKSEEQVPVQPEIPTNGSSRPPEESAVRTPQVEVSAETAEGNNAVIGISGEVQSVADAASDECSEDDMAAIDELATRLRNRTCLVK